MSDLSRLAADHDLAVLQARVLRRRHHQARSIQRSAMLAATFADYARELRSLSRRLPARYALHLLVGILVPLAILASQVPFASPHVLAPAAGVSQANIIIPIDPPAPLALDNEVDGETPAPDAAFAEIDALSPSSLSPDLLASQPVPAAVAADSANVRNGPGTNYDTIAELPAGTPLQVLAQYEGWYQARSNDGRMVWVAAELLNLDAVVADFLPQATTIPAPPPAKVGLVAEQQLNLRDGPGIDYVGMTKLDAGAQLDLLARYNDWFQVQTPEGRVGWVLGQYLAVGPGVVERVEAVTQVPDANPALVGVVQERNVNLRAGPAVAYDKRGGLGAGAQLDLLGRYKDWYKVRTPSGTVGWVSNELVQVSEFVARRVPTLRNLPALPQPQQLRSRPQAAGQAAPAPSAAAGSTVGFALQFVGSRYAWGGSSPKGFDCSGFTRYVYAQFGLNLPHSSAGQYSSKYGTPISNPADLRPGDIVFFVNTYKRGISHVGLYIGDGDVVQAMSPKLGVGVANLNGGYWAQHYYGAIRPAR
jgi:cell wall-associated NlpC family hydrolase